MPERPEDPDKLTDKEYREAYGRPSPRRRALERKKGGKKRSSKKKKKPTLEEVLEQLKSLSEEDRKDILDGLE